MNRRLRAAAAALLLLAPLPLAGQAVLDDPELDPVQTELRDALYRLRDSLTLVDAATARIARDIRTTSDQVLSSRARVVAERCAAAAGIVPATRDLVTQRKLPAPDPRKIREQLEQGLTTLERELRRCHDEFTGLATRARAQELRDYGIGRGERVRRTVLQYQVHPATYFPAVIGIRYRPSTSQQSGTPAASH